MRFHPLFEQLQVLVADLLVGQRVAQADVLLVVWGVFFGPVFNLARAVFRRDVLFHRSHDVFVFQIDHL